MAANDVIFRPQSPLLLAHTDLLTFDDDPKRRYNEGAIAWASDGFGKLRMYTYRKNINGSAFVAGELVSRKRDASGLVNQTGTTTTSATGTLTADENIGALAIVHDDAGGGGAAPEGEATIVASNTATVATFETDLPLSTALASGDDITLISPKVIDSAANDFPFIVCGIAMSAVPDDDWGWFQCQGLHPRALHKTTDAGTAGDPIKADTAAVAAETSWSKLSIGFQVATHGGDALQIKSPVLLSLLPAYL